MRQMIGPMLPVYNPVVSQNLQAGDYSKKIPLAQSGTVLGASTTNSGGAGGYNDDITSATNAKNLLLQQISNEYAGVNDAYKQQQDELKAQQEQLGPLQNVAEQEILNQYGSAVPMLNQQRESSLSQLRGQEETARRDTTGALNQARRLFNELSTRGQQFSGSSAGDAYGELLGRTTAEQMGNAKNALAGNVQNIRSEMGRVNDFYNQKLIDLENQKNLSLKQVQAEFREKLSAIRNNMSKLGLSQAEAQRQMAMENSKALAQFQNQVASIRKATQTSQEALNDFAVKRAGELASILQKTNLQINEGAGIEPLLSGDIQGLSGYLSTKSKNNQEESLPDFESF